MHENEKRLNMEIGDMKKRQPFTASEMGGLLLSIYPRLFLSHSHSSRIDHILTLRLLDGARKTVFDKRVVYPLERDLHGMPRSSGKFGPTNFLVTPALRTTVRVPTRV